MLPMPRFQPHKARRHADRPLLDLQMIALSVAVITLFAAVFFELI